MVEICVVYSIFCLIKMYGILIGRGSAVPEMLRWRGCRGTVKVERRGVLIPERLRGDVSLVPEMF
jgi:hypothetical protein